MPKLKQRTLLEFSGSSSPRKKTSPPKGKRPIIEIESDDSDSDPGRIKFERDGQADAVEGDVSLAAPRRSARIQDIRNDSSPSGSSSRSTPETRVAPKKSTRARRIKRLVVISDNESDTQRSTKRRRLVKGKRPDSRLDEVEDEDLEEEVDEDRILSSRLRDRPKKSDFTRNLERLQRRRRGEASASENEESQDEDSGSSSSRPTSLQVFHGAHPTANEEDSAEDGSINEDNDGFIIQDDGDEEPPELPAMFSMDTYQDLSHHFKVICQFYVHLAVQKPRKRRSFMEKEMKNNYFSVPLAIARRKLSGMKDSLVTSSIWKPEFKTPLESLPDFRLERLDFSIPLCDACHIGNRIATLRGVVGGWKYDRLTFESIVENDEEEPNEIEWNLGRFCAARAQVFHLFSHWEYILYYSLHKEVERLQEALSSRNDRNTRVYIPATQGVSPPDDPGDADGIMDWLDGRGIINFQWARVKAMMDRAHKLEGSKEAEEDLDIV